MDSTQLCERMRASLKARPLWEHALAFYGREGVADACLHLQDEAGGDVCELLWICWLQLHGLTPAKGVEVALGEVRRWQTQMTQPLRQRRRQLKASAQHSASLAELRAALKRAELLCERETLYQLQRLSEAGQGIRCLEAQDPTLAERLAQWLPKQKKTHLWALKTLETRLDRH
ncbi:MULTISPECIES: TIGR02444 family protein [Halomonadaceae]|uniref:TIGR02444 family protein n=1 Tax=Halomonadaceae TaxID=28256 RepID=UPI0015997D4F|nr:MULTISPECIES: TIGR02444 family protein [Halomonas]QJQ95467.1 TIGR02444 family protein [Halomonas sp. PA5]